MAKIYDLTGKEAGEIQLPKVFSTRYRHDLIKRAVLAIQSARRQAYGSDVLAGKRTSARYIGVQERFGMKNKEIARLKRTHGSSGQQERRARFSPQAVSGRKAHPPKVEKVWKKKINRKEMKAALMSAIAATANPELVKSKHHFDKEVPIIVANEIEKIKRTNELIKILEAIGLGGELERGKKKNVRAGKGKMRGRKYKRKRSFLMIVSDIGAPGKSGEGANIIKACKNISGADICNAKNLNVELLAPGCHAGRLVIFSENAVKMIGEIYG